MTCSDIRSRLPDYLEGGLDLQRRARFDAHLDACSGCAAEVSELRATVSLLRSLPDPEPPPNFADRVMARVEAGEAQPSLWARARMGFRLSRVSGWFSAPVLVPAAAGAALVALTLTNGTLDPAAWVPSNPSGSLEDASRPLQISEFSAPQPGEAEPAPAAPQPGEAEPAPAAPERRVARTPAPRVPERPNDSVQRSAPAPTIGELASRPTELAEAPTVRPPRIDRIFSSPSSIGRTAPPLIGSSAAAEATPAVPVAGGSGNSSSGFASAAPRRTVAPLGSSDDPAERLERRNRELDRRIEVLLVEPSRFAYLHGQESPGAQVNWIREIAKRGVERELGERILDTLRESGDLAALDLIDDFERELGRADPGVVAADHEATR